MGERNEQLLEIWERLEQTRSELEGAGRLGEALTAYEAIEKQLLKVGVMPFHSEYREAQRLLSVCLQRQGALLALFKRLPQLLDVSERQLAAGRASGDLLTLAGALQDYGAALLAAGPIDNSQKALHALEEARRLYESGEDETLRRELVKYWIKMSDLQLEGLLPGGASKARLFAERALSLSLALEDEDTSGRAQAAQARVDAALGNR